MNTTSQYLTDKKKKYTGQVEFHLRRFDEKAIRVPRARLYFVDIPATLHAFQENYFLLNEETYPEDHATFTVLNKLLSRLCAATPDEADLLVLPFNLFYYQHCREEVDELVRKAREAWPGKRFLFYFVSDFCLRPVSRALAFERQCLAGIAGNDLYFPAIIEETDLIIHFESTLDLIRDIAIFPLIATDIVSPFAQKKEYTFSFAGKYYKEGWPEGFIRSPSRRTAWEQLAARNTDIAYIGPGYNAGEELFNIIPQKSVFSLCPRGIAAWSFRLFESVLAGSIPIVFSDSYIKPFSEWIPWDQFAITVPESHLDHIDDLVLNISPYTIAFMQQQLEQQQARFTVNGLMQLLLLKLEDKLYPPIF